MILGKKPKPNETNKKQTEKRPEGTAVQKIKTSRAYASLPNIKKNVQA